MYIYNSDVDLYEYSHCNKREKRKKKFGKEPKVVKRRRERSINVRRVRAHTATRKDLRFVSSHVLTLAQLMAFVLCLSFKHVV